MTPQTELAIQDIQLPAAASGWPPAIGWWLLALLIIGSVIGAAVLLKRYQKKWGYRKAALALLKTEYKQWQHQSAEDTALTVKTLQNMLAILKRTAITAYPDANLSGMYGVQWIQALNQQTSAPCFTETLENIVIEQQYKTESTIDHSTIDISLIYSNCQQWIKQHATDYQQEPAHA